MSVSYPYQVGREFEVVRSWRDDECILSLPSRSRSKVVNKLNRKTLFSGLLFTESKLLSALRPLQFPPAVVCC